MQKGRLDISAANQLAHAGPQHGHNHLGREGRARSDLFGHGAALGFTEVLMQNRRR